MEKNLSEKRIEKVLNSLDNVSADPGEYFASKTIHRMKGSTQRNPSVSLVWKMAFAVLVLVNVASFTLPLTDTELLETDTISELTEEYFSYDSVIYDLTGEL